MSAVLNKMPDSALGLAALAIGGAALYMYFRGAKGAAQDATTAVGNAAMGVASGIVDLGLSGASAAGSAFVDVSQATFQNAQTKVNNCDYGVHGGVFSFASGVCMFSTAISKALGFGSSSSSDVVTTDSPMTAPGGGVIQSDASTFYSLFDGSNNGTSFSTFQDPNPNPVAGTTSWLDKADWAMNLSPSQPIRIGSTEYVKDMYGATHVVNVSGLRG